MFILHLWINTTKNSNSPDRCFHHSELAGHDTRSNPWPGLAAEVLRSWDTTLRAALLLVIAILGVVAIIVAKCVVAPFAITDLIYQIKLPRHTDRD